MKIQLENGDCEDKILTFNECKLGDLIFITIINKNGDKQRITLGVSDHNKIQIKSEEIGSKIIIGDSDEPFWAVVHP